MDILKVFSARAMSLLAFILVTLLVGTMFNVKLEPEPFTDLLKENYAHGNVNKNSGVNNNRKGPQPDTAAKQAAKQAVMGVVNSSVAHANSQFR